MTVTVFGIVKDPVSPSQLANACAPISFTELGIVISERPLQPYKALSPMLVTEPGIVIPESASQL